MAVQAKVVSFVSQLTAGAQSVTGVGFQGTLALFFAATTTNAEPCNVWMGLDDGVTHISRAFANKYFVGADNSEVAWSLSYSLVDNRAIAINQIGHTGYLSAWTADGFTVQWDTVGLAPGSVTWIAVVLGGDLDGVVSYAEWIASGVFTYTGVGFTPTGLLGWINGGVPASGFPTRSSGGGGYDVALSFAADPACGAAALALKGSPFVAPSDTASRQESGKLWVSTSGASGTLTTFTGTGWTANNSVGGGGLYHAYMALRGCACNVGTFTQPLATGVQRVTIPAAAPVVVLVASTNKVSAVGNTDDLLFSLGAATATEQMAVWTGALDNKAANGFEDNRTDLTMLGFTRQPTGLFTSTLTTAFTLAGMGDGYFDLNWSTVDGTAREWIYFVIAADLGGGPCGDAACSVTIDCATGVTTIAVPGGGIDAQATVTATGPSGASVPIDILSRTSTQILAHIQLVGDGEYCVTVTNPDPEPPPPAPPPWPPPIPPPPGPPPPPGSCTGTPTTAIPTAVRNILLANGATNCYSATVIAAAEASLNAIGYAPQRSSGCTIRPRLHYCPGNLNNTLCGHPMCSNFGFGARDIDIEAGGQWAWVPR